MSGPESPATPPGPVSSPVPVSRPFGRQYAVVVLNNRCKDRAWSRPLAPEVLRLTTSLVDTLKDPHACGLSPDRVTFLRDVPLSEFIQSMRALSTVVKPQDSVLVVLVGRSVRVRYGMAIGSYLVFKDTQGASNKQLARSACSAKTLRSVIRPLNTQNVCVVMDVTHRDASRPLRRGVFSSRENRLRRSFYQSLHSACGCVVLAGIDSADNRTVTDKSLREMYKTKLREMNATGFVSPTDFLSDLVAALSGGAALAGEASTRVADPDARVASLSASVSARKVKQFHTPRYFHASKAMAGPDPPPPSFDAPASVGDEAFNPDARDPPRRGVSVLDLWAFLWRRAVMRQARYMALLALPLPTHDPMSAEDAASDDVMSVSSASSGSTLAAESPRKDVETEVEKDGDAERAADVAEEGKEKAEGGEKKDDEGAAGQTTGSDAEDGEEGVEETKDSVSTDGSPTDDPTTATATTTTSSDGAAASSEDGDDTAMTTTTTTTDTTTKPSDGASGKPTPGKSRASIKARIKEQRRQSVIAKKLKASAVAKSTSAHGRGGYSDPDYLDEPKVPLWRVRVLERKVLANFGLMLEEVDGSRPDGIEPRLGLHNKEYPVRIKGLVPPVVHGSLTDKCEELVMAPNPPSKPDPPVCVTTTPYTMTVRWMMNAHTGCPGLHHALFIKGTGRAVKDWRLVTQPLTPARFVYFEGHHVRECQRASAGISMMGALATGCSGPTASLALSRWNESANPFAPKPPTNFVQKVVPDVGYTLAVRSWNVGGWGATSNVSVNQFSRKTPLTSVQQRVAKAAAGNMMELLRLLRHTPEDYGQTIACMKCMLLQLFRLKDFSVVETLVENDVLLGVLEAMGAAPLATGVQRYGLELLWMLKQALPIDKRDVLVIPESVVRTCLENHPTDYMLVDMGRRWATDMGVVLE